MNRLFVLLCFFSTSAYAQTSVHSKAHAHNDYEHARPLFDALQNGFTSVEADVHLKEAKLLVSHDRPGNDAKTLEQLYLAPLDSLLKKQGVVHAGYAGVFYLMIDVKTEAETTYAALQKAFKKYPRLLCQNSNCPVSIFISGNRAIEKMTAEGYHGLGIDGRPSDVGRGFSPELMPVISDNYNRWSSWNGKSAPKADELSKIRDLAQRVHAEGKKFRLWAIPDNEVAWTALLDAGVDFINTDRLADLNTFLTKRTN